MKLLKVREFADAERDGDTDGVYRDIRNGGIPVIQTGAKKGFRISMEMYRRHLRGEEIADRYFLKKGAA